MTLKRSRWSIRPSATLALCVLLLPPGGCLHDEERPTEPGPLLAGAGARPIDLPIGHSHAGYLQSRALGAPHPPDDPKSPFAHLFPATRGMQSQPYAKAVVFDNGRARLVLAKIDAVFATEALRERVLSLLVARHGLHLWHELILQASHTHGAGGRFLRDGPVPALLELEDWRLQPALVHGIDSYSQESLDRVASAVVESVAEAVRSVRPARIGVATASAPGASSDRRCHDDWLYGAGAIDDTVTVLRVEELSSGDPIAALFHFAVHGTVYGGSSRLLSVDTPGHAEHALEVLFDRPVVAMHLQGAAGDVAPNAAGHVGSQAMQRIGAVIAKAAREAWHRAELRHEVTLEVLVRSVGVDHDELGYGEGEFFEDGAAQCSVPVSGCATGAGSPDNVRCLSPIVEGTGKRRTSLAVARLDDLALVTLPGEPVSEAGRVLEEEARRLGYADAIVLGYAQDYDGYLLADEEDWLSGGYEPTIGFWGWRYGPFLVTKSAALLEELAAEGGLEERAPVKAPAPPLDEEPVNASGSDPAPAVEVEPPPSVARLDAVRFAFFAGDPALGTPTVALEREQGGGFVTVTTSWVPVTNRRGHEMTTFYEASPNYGEDPSASSRAHRYEVVYEPPRDLPEGSYRFFVDHRAKVGGEIVPISLSSRPFVVEPSTELEVDAIARVEGGRVVVRATLRYPAAAPAFSATTGNEGSQISGFRLVDERFPAPFVPVVEGGVAAAAAVIESADGVRTTLPLLFVETATESTPYAPGDGAGFIGDVPLPDGEGLQLILEAGVLEDAFGNKSRASTAIVGLREE